MEPKVDTTVIAPQIRREHRLTPGVLSVIRARYSEGALSAALPG
jgi:hypothetical protein